MSFSRVPSARSPLLNDDWKSGGDILSKFEKKIISDLNYKSCKDFSGHAFWVFYFVNLKIDIVKGKFLKRMGSGVRAC